MPRNKDIKKVLVIGSGPIIIGQAAEFDYAGTQACRSLKEEGIEVVLLNSNPATIMTDKDIADRVYIEPLTVEVVEQLILKEKPDSVLPTLGGQAGLNLAMELDEKGFLKEHNIRLIGTTAQTIKKAEDRQEFKDTMEKIGEPIAASKVVTTVEDGLAFTNIIGYPVVLRPAYTLGGSGGGIAHNEYELREILENGLRLSRVGEVLVERCIAGWKEIEYEVMRDSAGNCITVCNMENIDPVGVHTGDSIVVAPSQTLGDKEYQMLRTSALNIITELGITGGCNVQYALKPDSFEYCVIEVNPRVSRSSALASKATGYPIAKVAAKIALGYTLDEIPNAITGKTYASFEPMLDYCVVKIPRLPFDKFITAKRTLTTQMKATGEVMSICHNFEGALMKAIRSVKISYAEISKFPAVKRDLALLIDKNSMQFATDEFYLKSEDEMKALGFPQSAYDNTVKIAEKCNVSFTFGHTILPFFKAEGYDNNEIYFNAQVRKGLVKRYGDPVPKEVLDRAEYEMSVIKKMGFIDYFLIVADFIGYAKRNGIAVGPGRGSGAGSVCAYCLGITDIDPIRFNLLFERFLNPERVTMPDFDVDFCYIRRQEVIDYVVRKYGRDHVAQIITFGTMAARGAIRDAGRAMGLPYGKVDTVAKLIPMSMHSTIDGALKSEKELVKLASSDSEVSLLIETAKKIEGMARNTSIHAAGIVITRDPVADYVPLYQNSEGEVMTQYTMTAIERLGLLKMDFLGLRYLTVIQDCCKLVAKTCPDFDIEKIPENDAETYDMMSSGGTLGVFQFESAGMTSLLSRMKPRSVEDLTAALSLYRPGPMDSIPTYLANRRSPEKIRYKHPLLKGILDVTYGCIVYQEQVMMICRVLAGYSYGRADIVRRAMAKKKPEVMVKERATFVEGAVANNVDRQVAEEIFDDMMSFASYAFNKSHAAAYSLLAYRTAYLRCHYYKEYMVALLTSVIGWGGKTAEYIGDLAQHGLKLLPPHVNYSETGFSCENDGIRFGLLAIKNVGANMIADIIEERTKHPFKSLFDFCERMSDKNINKRALESLIKCGAFDGLGNNRREMMISLELMLDTLSQRHDLEGQMSLMGEDDAADEGTFQIKPADEYSHAQLLSYEKEMLGIYISGHPADPFYRIARESGYENIGSILENNKDKQNVRVTALLTSVRNHITKSGKTMGFIVIEDASGEIECLVFPKLYEQYSSMLRAGNVYAFEGTVSAEDEGDPKLLINAITQPDLAKLRKMHESRKTGQNKAAVLYIRFSSRDDANIPAVKALLKVNKGNTLTKICFEDTRETITLPPALSVDLNSDFIQKLNGICGKNNIIIK